MTLSHCWGFTDCPKLTTDNRAQLLDQIPLPLLPQLYQDAVYVTRHLGIKYLWIDSLCIIQWGDESTDWRHEVMLMDKVYSNSFCNISPTDAPDSHHSVFSVRDPHVLYPQIVNVSTNRKVTQYVVLHSDFWQTEVSRARLNRRAWVLQERLLSPRVLHFSRNQMLWECREKDASEIYPDGLPLELFGSSYGRFKDLTHHAATGETNGAVAAYRSWTRIVRAYTICDLTFPSDKLVALSAVAKVMANVLQDDYVAGMWRRYLERELLWSVRQSRGGYRTQPTIYRAPSWSWTATDNEVDPGLLAVGAADMLIEAQDVQLDYTADDKTGLIKGGWLRLRGVLKQLVILPHHSSSSGSCRDWSMIVNGVQVSVLSDSAEREPQPHVMLDAPHRHFDEEITDGNLYCMPARVREGDEGSIYVLILLLEDRKWGIFRRVGLARGWGKDVKDKVLARTTEESKLPCEEYRDGLHTIRII